MTLTSLPPAGGIHRGVQYFNECLRASKHFSNLTEELERTGDVTNFHFKLPQVHDVEKRFIAHQKMIKISAETKAESACKDHELMTSLVPESVGALSIDELIATIEKSKNVRVVSFEDIIKYMAVLTAEEFLKVAGPTAQPRVLQKVNSDFADGEKDLFSDDEELPNEPELPKTPELTIQPSTPQPTTSKRIIEFPSAKRMIGTVKKNMTPSSDVFRFGEHEAPITQTAKAPRIYKPGEIAFSVRGSPILLPKVPVRTETFPVTDEDGKKIVDVVLYAGDQEKRKEYLSIATDIRGVVASRTVRQPNRVQPSRVARSARKAGPASAKKPEWRS